MCANQMKPSKDPSPHLSTFPYLFCQTPYIFTKVHSRQNMALKNPSRIKKLYFTAGLVNAVPLLVTLPREMDLRSTQQRLQDSPSLLISRAVSITMLDHGWTGYPMKASIINGHEYMCAINKSKD